MKLPAGAPVGDAQPQIRTPSRRATAAAGRVVAFGHDQRLGVQVGQVEVELVVAVGRVERRGGGAGGDGDEGRRHLRPVRQHDGDPVVAADADAVQRCDGVSPARASRRDRGSAARAPGSPGPRPGRRPAARDRRRLLRRVRIAKQYLLTGDPLAAEEAERIGLVNEAVPAADVLERGRWWASRLAAGAPMAVRATKITVTAQVKRALLESFDLSTSLELMTFLSEDHKEALATLKERRPPEFRGR